MVTELSLKRAEKLLNQGLRYVEAGALSEARQAFKESLKWNESAQSLTYWGWMEHHFGDTPLAIRLCHQAISVDPDFGNPYNDIGSYLVSMGKEDEAVSWFKKAMLAKDYEPRQFPHMNLGRIYLSQRKPSKALQEFEKALDYLPGDPNILATMESIRRLLN